MLRQYHPTNMCSVMKKLQVHILITIGGELIQQRNPDEFYTGEGKDKIGPGQYNIDRELFNKYKGTNWHASNVPRKIYDMKNDEENVGPGAYNVSRHSSFLSNTKDSSVLNGRLGKSTVIGFGSEFSRYDNEYDTDSEVDKVRFN